MLTRPRTHAWHPRRRATASLEFALVAPVLSCALFGVYDTARALLIWQQIDAAAEAIAQAGEKLSVTPGSSATSLTATQMQTAMSTLYAVIPGLNFGNNTGVDRGTYAVTLSSVAYLPLCVQILGCTPETYLPQVPYTLWSSYLTQGGSQLDQTPTLANPLLRLCGVLISVAQFALDATQLTTMVNPTKVPNGVAMILTPQIVADVQYTFTPSVPLFVHQVTLRASASLPTPLGGTDQEITFNTNSLLGNVLSCSLPS